MQEKVETVEKRMEKLEKKTEEREAAEDDGMFEELRAREAIRRNLVVYGLEEPDQSIKEGKDRMEADKSECENIFNTIGSKARHTDIRFCRRLGERGEDARPLLLGMTSETVKCEVLDRAKELQNTEYQHIGNGPDRTWTRGRGKRVRTDEAMEEDERPPRTRTKQ